MSSWFAELENLFFPQSCVGCGRWDTALCEECAAAFAGTWIAVQDYARDVSHVVPVSAPRQALTWEGDVVPAFPVWALGAYEGVRREVIVAWKNMLNRDLTQTVRTVLRSRVRVLGMLLGGYGIDCICVIPAPSRRRRKRENLFVTGHIAQACVQGFMDAGVRAVVCDVLRVQENVQGRREKSMAISCVADLPQGWRYVIVDDVVTTGATLSGCARALEEVGVHVDFAVVLAGRRVGEDE